jgi:hypothetical protein
MKPNIRSLMARPEMAALLIFLALFVTFSIINDRFLTTGNMTVYLQPIPELAIVAIGITILIIAGEFDLSVGSVFAPGSDGHRAPDDTGRLADGARHPRSASSLSRCHRLRQRR